MDDRKIAGERASNEMVMGAVQAFCELFVLVCQHNHTDQSITARDNALH